MSDQDPLATLEALLKEATPGSVYVSYDLNGFPVIHLDENDDDEDSHEPIARFTSGVDMDRFDAALYAHLRNLAPALVELWKAAREWLSTDEGDVSGRLHRLVVALRALEVKK